MKAMNPEDHFEHLRTVHFSLLVTNCAVTAFSRRHRERRGDVAFIRCFPGGTLAAIPTMRNEFRPSCDSDSTMRAPQLAGFPAGQAERPIWDPGVAHDCRVVLRLSRLPFGEKPPCGVSRCGRV